MTSVSQQQKMNDKAFSDMRHRQIDKNLDPKTMVTPFAFEIAPNVLYTPLASPLKRGLAMLVDGLLISVLAEQAGWMFILLVGATLLIQRRSRQLGKLFKWGLYLSMLGMMLWVTVGNILPTSGPEVIYEEQVNPDVQSTMETVGELINYLPNIINFSSCDSYLCAQSELNTLLPLLDDAQLPPSEKASMILNIIEDLSLSDEDKFKLKQQADQYIQLANDKEVSSAVKAQSEQLLQTKSPMSDTFDAVSTEIAPPPIVSTPSSVLPTISPQTQLEQLASQDDEAEEEESYSLLSWAKGILNDLGLGFGWAAFYFTVFTAWFDGQTLGKKLLRIRVIQLDGSKLSLWHAFGRYGGYGAGFATGLLGFLQIYWDANRQAIQDKISATVVIDMSRERVAPQHSVDNSKEV